MEDVNFADAQDGLYNADKAKAELAKAKKVLEADGVNSQSTWIFQLTKHLKTISLVSNH